MRKPKAHKVRTWTYDEAELYRAVMPKAVVGFFVVNGFVVEHADYIKKAVAASGGDAETLIEILTSEWGATVEPLAK